MPCELDERRSLAATRWRLENNSLPFDQSGIQRPGWHVFDRVALLIQLDRVETDQRAAGPTKIAIPGVCYFLGGFPCPFERRRQFRRHRRRDSQLISANVGVCRIRAAK